MPATDRLFCLLLLSLLLVGCAALPPADEGEGRVAADVDHFLLEGKVAWRHPRERGNANLSWTQQDESYRLLLTGPLGQGAVTVEGEPERVLVSSARGQQQAASADALLEHELGFSVPVEQARWWVLGLPAPDAGVDAAAARPGAEGVHQLGWQVQWSDWRQVGDYAVPRRVRLERDDLQLTFVIGAWQLGSAER